MSALVEQISQSRSNSRIHGSITSAMGNPAHLETITFQRVEVPVLIPREVADFEPLDLPSGGTKGGKGKRGRAPKLAPAVPSPFDPFADFGAPLPVAAPAKRKAKEKPAGKKAKSQSKPKIVGK